MMIEARRLKPAGFFVSSGNHVRAAAIGSRGRR
jgi:hypothetical protein